MDHIAILHAPYIDAILSGAKTVESRLSLHRRAPWGVVEPGHTVYFKQRSGPFRLRATAGRIDLWEDLAPRDVDELAREHRHTVCAPASYWRGKRTARYATLIWLDDITPIDEGPAHPPMYGRGWLTLTPGRHTSNCAA